MQKLIQQEITSKLPFGRLLTLSLLGFLVIMTENTPAGLLTSISKSLGISPGLAGQMLTVYAIGSVLSAIPIVTLTRGIDRLPLLLATTAILAIFNAITALSPYYPLTLLARFIAGMASGVVWALLPGYGKRMSPIEKQGKAMSIVGLGQPIALCIGVPLASWLGTVFSWRGVFWVISVVAVMLIILMFIFIPNFPGQTGENQQNLRQVIRFPGILAILGVIFTTVLAHNILYTYISTFLLAYGFPPQSVSLGLLIFGICAVIGIGVLGYCIDKNLRATILSYIVIFVISGIVLNWALVTTIAVIGIILWGFSFGGIPVVLQTAMVKAGKSEADVAISMMVTVFNGAIAIGALLGGILLNIIHITKFPLWLAGIGFLALIISLCAKRGFPTATTEASTSSL